MVTLITACLIDAAFASFPTTQDVIKKERKRLQAELSAKHASKPAAAVASTQSTSVEDDIVSMQQHLVELNNRVSSTTCTPPSPQRPGVLTLCSRHHLAGIRALCGGALQISLHLGARHNPKSAFVLTLLCACCTFFHARNMPHKLHSTGTTSTAASNLVLHTVSYLVWASCMVSCIACCTCMQMLVITDSLTAVSSELTNPKTRAGERDLLSTKLVVLQVSPRSPP